MNTNISSCIVCGKEEAETGPLTDTHLIPNALGGRIKPKIACESCNGLLNSVADAGLTQSLSSFAKQINVRRDRWDHPPIKAEGTSGEQYHLEPGTFAPTLAKSHSSVLLQPDGSVAIDIKAPDERTALNELYRLRKLHNLDFDPTQILAGYSAVSEPVGAVKIGVEIGPKNVFAGALACMWLFASWKEGNGITSRDALEERLTNAASDSAIWYYDAQPWLLGLLPTYSHRILVKSHTATQQLIGYVSYFDIVTIGAVLATNYSASTEALYVYDLMEGKELGDSLHIDDNSFQNLALDRQVVLRFKEDHDRLMGSVKNCVSVLGEKLLLIGPVPD